MVSRTFEGKHTTRFIIEIKDVEGKYFRSAFLNKFYPTREEAQTVIATKGDSTLTYRVRQK
jgi:hypothetical protein